MRYLYTVMLLVAAICSAQQMDLMHTGPLGNGRLWNESTSDQKSYYLLGVRDSEALASGKQHWWAKGFTVGDYLKELDKLYGNTENLNIPMIWMVNYCTAKLGGEKTNAQSEEMLIILRKLAREMKSQ